MSKNSIQKKGYLKVSNLHSIYYEDCGTTSAKPSLFIHGSSRAGFSEQDKRFFNFEKQRVIFYNQRDVSKSKPLEVF